MPISRKAPTVTGGGSVLDIPDVQQGRIELNVLGTSPLICNRMSEKARRELLLPAGRKTAADRISTLKHDPIAEYRASPYTLPEGPTVIALMASSFKGAMGTAALDLPGARKAQIGRLVYVEGDYVSVYGEPKLFMSITRSADMNHTPDVRTRAIVPEWACKLTIAFVEPLVRAADVARLLHASGVTAGVGDYRPEKGKGGYGRYKVVNEDDPEWQRIVREGGREVQAAALANPKVYDQESGTLLSWYSETAVSRGFRPTLKEGEDDA